jgi:hypothetical protein
VATRWVAEFRVGLKGAGGLVNEVNETVESVALQNSRLVPDAPSTAGKAVGLPTA